MIALWATYLLTLISIVFGKVTQTDYEQHIITSSEDMTSIRPLVIWHGLGNSSIWSFIMIPRLLTLAYNRRQLCIRGNDWIRQPDQRSTPRNLCSSRFSGREPRRRPPGRHSQYSTRTLNFNQVLSVLTLLIVWKCERANWASSIAIKGHSWTLRGIRCNRLLPRSVHSVVISA